MPTFPSLTSIKLHAVARSLAAAALVFAVASPAFARAGVSGPAAVPAVGNTGRFGSPPTGFYPRGGGRFLTNGVVRNGRGRGNAQRSYYPSAPFGPFGGLYDGYPASTGPARETPPSVDTSPRTVTIIQRGPAFGEPGYISHPAIYRLSPAVARTPGTRRFKVERMDF